MNKHIYIFIVTALLLVSCGTQKVKQSESPAPPLWQTCLIKGAQASIEIQKKNSQSSDKISAAVTMQVVRDSIAIISIMPILGMEMVRIEATPEKVIGISKIHGLYIDCNYEELNRYIAPTIDWGIIQQLCAAELPTGDTNARVVYIINGQTITLSIDYTPKQTDIPLTIQRQRLTRYKQTSIAQWL